MIWQVVVPDPQDVSPAPRKPWQKQEGVYFFHRPPLDTEVTIWEPNKDTYILEYFEFEKFLRLLLEVPEERRLRILDNLWGFFRVAMHVPSYRHVILRTQDVDGWENEVCLFNLEPRSYIV